MRIVLASVLVCLAGLPAAGAEPTTRPAERLRELRVSPGDEVELEFDGRQDRVVVQQSRPVLRYVRQIEGRWVPAEGQLLYGIPYHVEASHQGPNPPFSVWIKLEWGDRDIDRHDMLLERQETPDPQRAIYRSAEPVVFEDPRR